MALLFRGMDSRGLITLIEPISTLASEKPIPQKKEGRLKNQKMLKQFELAVKQNKEEVFESQLDMN